MAKKAGQTASQIRKAAKKTLGKGYRASKKGGSGGGG